jgi:hypothetical protein
MAKVKIVADYDGEGYWLADDAARAIGDLPVSEALRQRLIAWNAWYDRDCDPDAYSDPAGIRFDFVAFSAAGLALAKAVKRELPDWTVLYWDEAVDWKLQREMRRFDRSVVEYEITLEASLSGDPDGPP